MRAVRSAQHFPCLAKGLPDQVLQQEGRLHRGRDLFGFKYNFKAVFCAKLGSSRSANEAESYKQADLYELSVRLKKGINI